MAAWLERNNLSQFADSFVVQGISGDLLPELNNEFLRELLGVTKAGDLLRFNLAVKPYRREQPSRARDEL